MVGTLTFFYKFYQTCETPQCIDLSKDKNKYLLPTNHPASRAIASQGLPKIFTKASQFNDHGIFSINEAPNWLLRKRKQACSFIGNAPLGPFSSDILRVVMNHRLKKEVKDKRLDVIIPNEYLVDASRQKHTTETYEDFFVVSQKLDIFSYKETIELIHAFDPQKNQELATTICQLIYHSGFMDAHMANIALTKTHVLAIVDTEGHSLFHDLSENYSPISLSKARIVGLAEFIKHSKSAGLPEVFIDTAEKYLFYAHIMHTLKIATIMISILCPLIPLAVLIISVAAAKLGALFGSSDEIEHSLPLSI